MQETCGSWKREQRPDMRPSEASCSVCKVDRFCFASCEIERCKKKSKRDSMPAKQFRFQFIRHDYRRSNDALCNDRLSIAGNYTAYNLIIGSIKAAHLFGVPNQTANTEHAYIQVATPGNTAVE